MLIRSILQSRWLVTGVLVGLVAVLVACGSDGNGRKAMRQFLDHAQSPVMW